MALMPSIIGICLYLSPCRANAPAQEISIRLAAFRRDPSERSQLARPRLQIAKANAMRFLCDAMLGGLVRWLRAAGYDSLLAEGSWRDRELVDLCAREQRILLTQDRELGIIAPAVVPVLLLAARDLDHNARELREVLGVDWQHAPFTRCLVDNTVLEAAEQHHREHVPPSSRRVTEPLRLCPTCGRLYWPGGHVRRMQRRLAGWQGGQAGAGDC